MSKKDMEWELKNANSIKNNSCNSTGSAKADCAKDTEGYEAAKQCFTQICRTAQCKTKYQGSNECISAPYFGRR
jgi:hypothetical protein